MFVIMTGNPIDGMSLVGPFVDHDAAHNWVNNDAHIDDHDWLIVNLEQSGDTLDYKNGPVPEPTI